MRSSRLSRTFIIVLAALHLAVPGLAWGLDANAVYESIKDSVVMVYRMRGDKDYKGFGSGFAVGDGTLVVTNQHVVGSASAVLRVKLRDGSILDDVKVIRLSSADDLAVIKLPRALPPLKLATEKAKVGQEVAVMGNPKGLEATLSTGNVSGFRTIDPWGDVLQISAPISPGSSGGAVLDAKARVLAVACGHLLGDGQNLNFAVPVEKLRRLMGHDLLPEEGDAPAASGSSSGGLDVQKSSDGSITIIQQKKRK